MQLLAKTTHHLEPHKAEVDRAQMRPNPHELQAGLSAPSALQAEAETYRHAPRDAACPPRDWPPRAAHSRGLFLWIR